MLQRWIWGTTLAPQAHLLAGFAAAIAFYMVLSAAPLIVVAIGIVMQFLPVDLSDGMDKLLQRIIPEGTLLDPDILIETARRAAGRGVLTLSFVFALWSSSNFMTQMVSSLRNIFKAGQSRPPSGWANRALSFLLMLLWGLLMTVAATLVVLAPVVEIHIDELGLLSDPVLWVGRLVRHFLAFFLLFFLFWITYRVTAGRAYPTKRLALVSLGASIGWLLLGWVFSHILSKLWMQSAIYGTLGSVVATLMWAYLSAWIILLGACWLVRRAK